MTEENNGLPPQMTVEEMEARMDFLPGDNWMDEDADACRLDFTKPYEPPKYLLSYNDTGFAPLGGTQAITGQSGNGKTMTIAQFIAAILGGSYGNLRYNLADTIPDPRVLYIDTEMEEDNTIAMKNRVLSMTGRIIGEDYDDFVVLMLRELQGDGKGVSAAIKRWRTTLKAIWQYRPTVVFIDGLLDVVNDFNNNTECQELIYKCMQTATHYGISLWCLVHQNPGADKLVGHLGSMLERKVTDIFETRKEKNPTTGSVTFTVKQKKARGRDVPDWMFRIKSEKAWGEPEQLNSEPALNESPDSIKQWLMTGRYDIEWPATKEQIKTIIKNRGGVTSNPALLDNLRVAINMRYVIEQPAETRKKGQTHIKYILNPEFYPSDKIFGEPTDNVPY